MGLDMYLYKKHHVKNYNYQPAKSRHCVTVTKAGMLRTDINPAHITSVTEEVARWRKTNAVHKWFVDTVQDGVDNCATYVVDAAQLAALLDIVTRVLDAPATATKLLPTYDGSFFGSEDYDDDYYADLMSTQEVLTAVLAAPNPEDASFAYQADW